MIIVYNFGYVKYIIRITLLLFSPYLDISSFLRYNENNFYCGCLYIMQDTPTIPLSNVSSGKKVQIINIVAGWGLQRRLADMGLTPGLRVTIVGNHKPGAVVLDVRGSRLALGRGISNKIMVQL